MKLINIIKAATLACLGMGLIAGFTPARADQDIPLQFAMPAKVHLNIGSEDCDNSQGPYITLSGSIALGGYSADLIFKNNVKGTKRVEVKGVQTALLLDWGSTIQIPKQPSRGGVGGNPHIWLQFFDHQNNAMTDELYLGRCVQGFQADPSFLIEVIGKHHIHGEGCSNRKGPFLTLDSTLTLASGLKAKLTFRNQTNGNGLPPAEASAVVDLLLSGTQMILPKQPVNGGVGGNPIIAVKFNHGDGSPITGEITLGRCNTL
jgi:hypothetical protein